MHRRLVTLKTRTYSHRDKITRCVGRHFVLADPLAFVENKDFDCLFLRADGFFRIRPGAVVVVVVVVVAV